MGRLPQRVADRRRRHRPASVRTRRWRRMTLRPIFQSCRRARTLRRVPHRRQARPLCPSRHLRRPCRKTLRNPPTYRQIRPLRQTLAQWSRRLRWPHPAERTTPLPILRRRGFSRLNRRRRPRAESAPIRRAYVQPATCRKILPRVIFQPEPERRWRQVYR